MSTSRPTRLTIAPSAANRFQDVMRQLSFRNASAIWVLVVVVVVFSVTIPRTFLAPGTWASLLDAQVVIAITAIAVVLPLAAGVFNLAIGMQVGTASIMLGWLLVPMGVPIAVAIPVTIIASAAIGFLTGVIIVVFRIDSFIATMGVSSLLTALIAVLSGSRQILGMPTELVDFATSKLVGLTYPFLTMLLLGLVVWYFLERTPLGRRIYAVGGNMEAARLSGIRVGGVVIGSLTASGALLGVAGVMLTSRLGNADPTIGAAYLLPAFTAAFLGSTQFRGGRFNIWGTVLSVYVLAIGIKGLQLSGAPTWISDAFNGAALLVAVGLAASARYGGRPSLIQRLRTRWRDRRAAGDGTTAVTPDAPQPEAQSTQVSPAIPVAADEPAPSLAESEFKRLFRGHPGGVAVITAASNGVQVALTATSVASVSADPPIIMFSLSRSSSAMPTIAAARTVVVHLLDSDDLELARLGATSGVDRFADAASWTRLDSGEPVFHGARAWARCEVVSKLDAGGSVVVTVRAIEAEIRRDDAHPGAGPLVYHNRTWHRLSADSAIG